MMPEPPRRLPVFPLTGVLLLPGSFLPLNVFEPRYRALVEDCLEGSGYIGMVQPLVPAADNRGPLGDESTLPRLYAVGCAGLMTRCEPQKDGRYLILLRGVQRFRIAEELVVGRPYRVVRARYGGFSDHLEAESEEISTSRLLAALRSFCSRRRLEMDLERLASVPAGSLLNGLCCALPLGAAEKQALLEAASAEERQELLIRLLEMGEAEVLEGDGVTPPTVH